MRWMLRCIQIAKGLLLRERKRKSVLVGLRFARIWLHLLGNWIWDLFCLPIKLARPRTNRHVRVKMVFGGSRRWIGCLPSNCRRRQLTRIFRNDVLFEPVLDSGLFILASVVWHLVFYQVLQVFVIAPLCLQIRVPFLLFGPLLLHFIVDYSRNTGDCGLARPAWYARCVDVRRLVAWVGLFLPVLANCTFQLATEVCKRYSQLLEHGDFILYL